jgi:hypothetical protein
MVEKSLNGHKTRVFTSEMETVIKGNFFPGESNAQLYSVGLRNQSRSRSRSPNATDSQSVSQLVLVSSPGRGSSPDMS